MQRRPNMPTFHNRTGRRVLLATAAAAFVLALSAEASAVPTILNDPFGNAASTAYVARSTSLFFNNHYILWKNNATGACSMTSLGSAVGLAADFEVHGQGGNDF